MFAHRFGFRRRSRVAGMFAAAFALWCGQTSRAADVTWGNGAGDFLWNTTSNDWGAGVPWSNLTWDGAVFGATGVGTVTVDPGINVRSLNFGTNNGYTLTGGSLVLSQLGTSSLSAGTINVGGTTAALTATTATVNTSLVSSTGLNKTGDGVLVLGGTNTIGGYRQLGGSGLGVNVLIGNATTSDYGGSLRVTNAAALGTATVGIGNGLLDLQTDVTLSGLTFTNTRANTATWPATPTQGVVGTGTLTMSGAIRVIGNGTGWSNLIATNVNANGGTLRVEVGSGSNANRELIVTGVIGNGSLFKTFGVGTNGVASAGSFTLLGNNTYTGATTINGGTVGTGPNNVIAGTNASTALTVVNSFTTLQGANGGYGSATTVRLVSGANLTLSDTAAQNSGNEPPVAAGVLNNRLGTAASLTLDGGTLTLTGGTAGDALQTLASVSAPQGFNRIALTAGGGFNAVVTAGSLSLGTGSTLVVGGAAVGDTTTLSPTATRFVVTGGTPAAVNGLIPGLYAAASPAGAPTTFATTSGTAGVGIVGLAASDYTSLAAATATSNVDVNTAAAAVSADTAVNAVRTNQNVTINGGATLTVGAGGVLTTAAVTVSGPGTLAFGGPGLLTVNSSPTTFSAAITGSAGLYRSGNGTLTLSGDLSGLSGGLTLAGTSTTTLNTATYAGPITLLSGTLAATANIGTGGPVTLGTPNTPAGTVGATTTLNINTAAVPTFARNIAVVGGDGTSPFAGPNGMVLTALTSANQTVSGTITLGTHLSVNGATAAGAVTTLSGAISGAGGLNVLTGSVALTNASNTFAGGLQLNGGTTSATSDAAFGTGAVRLLGGTLRTDYAGNFNRGVTVLTSGTFNQNGNDVTIAAPITGENPAATFNKSGSGVLTVTSASPFPGTVALGAGTTGGITLAGANGALTGATAVAAPTGTALTLDNTAAYNGNRVGDATTVNLTGGLLNYLAPAVNTGATAERFGQLVIGGNGSVVNIDGGAAVSPTVLRFAGVTVTGGNVTLRGTALGDTTGNYTRVYFDNFTSNLALIPNVFFTNTAGTGTSTAPAAYDTTRGVILFTPPPASGTTIDNFAPTNTPLLAAFTTNGDAVANTGAQVYSLTLDGGSTLTLNDVNAAAGTNNNTPIGTLRLAGGFLTSQNGAKTIQGGTGAAAKVVDFGASAGVVTTTSDLTVASGVTLTGTGGLIKGGAGALTINGTYSVTGAMTVNAGTISLPAALTLPSLTVNAGAVNTNNNNLTVSALAGTGGAVNVGAGTLTVNQTTNTTYAGNIQSSTGFVKLGAGSLTLSGPLTYTAAAQVREGGLVLGASNVLPAAQPVVIGLNGQFLGNTAFLDLNGTNQTVGGLSFYAKQSGGAAAQVTGAGTLTVTGNIAFLDATGDPGNGFAANVASSVTAVDLGGAVRNVTVAGNRNPGGDLVFNAPIANGGINYTGTDSTKDGSRAVFSLAANNTYAGGTTVNGGTLSVAATGTLGTGGLVLNTAATPSSVNFAGSATIASLATGTLGTGAATVNLNGAASTLTVNQATTTTYAGVIAGAGGLTKSGAGTLALTGTNTYTGPTAVNGGVLAGTGTIPTATAVNAGAFLSGGSPTAPTGTLTVSNTVTLTNNGGLQATVNRNTATASLVSVTGTNVLNLNPGNGNTFAVRLVSDPASPMVSGEAYTVTLASVGAAGNIQLNGAGQSAGAVIPTAAYTISSPEFSTFNNVSLTIDSINGTNLVLAFTPVPEPTTAVAFGGAVLAAGAFARRRLKARRGQAGTAATA